MNTAESTSESGTNGEPQTKGTDMRGRNWMVMIATLLVIGLSGIVMNGCESANQIQDKQEEKDQGVVEEKDGESGVKESIVERDYLSPPPKVGDIVDEVINPITGAKAYAEMEKDPNDPYGALSRVIVEYKGKITKMSPSSAILQFSPDGKYLLYIARLSPRSESGTYIYNVETGRVQELIPSVLRDDPRFIPFPEDITWEGNEITYEKSGNWTLTYEEE